MRIELQKNTIQVQFRLIILLRGPVRRAIVCAFCQATDHEPHLFSLLEDLLSKSVGQEVLVVSYLDSPALRAAEYSVVCFW